MDLLPTKMPDKTTNEIVIQRMAAQITDYIKTLIDGGFSKIEAIKKAENESCAGHKVWDIVNQNILAYD